MPNSWTSKDLPLISPDDPSMWTVAVAAEVLGIDEPDLRVLIRLAGISPKGKMQVRTYRSQGRAAAAYDTKELMAINEIVSELRELGNV